MSRSSSSSQLPPRGAAEAPCPAGCAVTPASGRGGGPRVYSDAGNIVIERNGVKTQLTNSEQDVDPVLAPDGSYVVYTRQGRGHGLPGYDLGQFCTDGAEARRAAPVNVDGSGDKLLLEGRKGDGQAAALRLSRTSSSAPTARGSIS